MAEAGTITYWRDRAVGVGMRTHGYFATMGALCECGYAYPASEFSSMLFNDYPVVMTPEMARSPLVSHGPWHACGGRITIEAPVPVYFDTETGGVWRRMDGSSLYG